MIDNLTKNIRNNIIDIFIPLIEYRWCYLNILYSSWIVSVRISIFMQRLEIYLQTEVGRNRRNWIDHHTSPYNNLDQDHFSIDKIYSHLHNTSKEILGPPTIFRYTQVQSFDNDRSLLIDFVHCLSLNSIFVWYHCIYLQSIKSTILQGNSSTYSNSDYSS